ncbi:DUF1653 domain-containing protein [Streptomyces albogriseolus]|uniref:DUF1653 domain-containing protein n=1 Tax=Streptomyces albogriseolus TaxID=1887 RepID=UPI00345FA1C2
MNDIDDQWLTIDYTNHRGERGVRTVRPYRVWFGQTSWHPEEEWLLEAYDRDRQAVRNFSLRWIHDWDARECSEADTRVTKGIYRHFKGQLYEVLATLQHSESGEEMVAYRALHGTFGLWVRPRAMFVSHVRGPEGDLVQRFKFISASPKNVD